MKIDTFEHKMAAHCETGAVTALLKHAGMEITEPMVFGISSGIFFGYMSTPNFPFPTIIVRNQPGQIRKNVAKRLGVNFTGQKFKTSGEAENELDKLLEKNIPVAVQVDFFHMEYLPEWERVHMNVHFVIIVGKEGDDYLISDSYFPKIAKLNKEALRKGRFAKGSMAPKGFMFYVESVPESPVFKPAIIKGIKKAVFYMIKLPIPFIGVKGIRKFAKKVVGWPKLARDTEHLSHEIMKINVLLEDQGTGGAGFRFMYASFLKQASEMLKSNDLEEMSKRYMQIGDKWREISAFTAKIGKKRDLGTDRLSELSEMIMDRADAEQEFFKDLQILIKKI